MKQSLILDTIPAYEEIYLLGYNAVWSGKIQPQFHIAFSSELESKPTRNQHETGSKP
jgi:hypothetical protein